jgi:uncharacterized protein
MILSATLYLFKTTSEGRLPMNHNVLSPLPLSGVQITDPFFGKRVHTARTVAIPYMWEALNDRVENVPKSYCVSNFRVAAGLAKGEHGGFVFQDSDLYKWIEGAAYSLETCPDKKLEADVDGIVALMKAAQQPDGYLDTYYIITGLDKRWTNLRDNHELYCAGHMMEAAVAYKNATGKGELLAIACAFADHIDSVFGRSGKKRGYPGHQEVEIGLCRLYEATGEERYLLLARYFLTERGAQPHYFDEEAAARGETDGGKHSYAYRHGTAPYCYCQAHKPVLEQDAAVGHAVRAGYMMAGMADAARLSGDKALANAAETLFANVTEKQMYITGGIGAMREGEAFTFDYDLPNDRMYTETCASIALLMTAERMHRLSPSARYSDIAEKTLFNGILSGISLDGTRYFYTNPMEMWPERCARRMDMGVDAVRQGWFGCACCPPNVLRTLTGLGRYLYSVSPDEVYVNQYIASVARVPLAGGQTVITQEGNYPWDGAITLRVETSAPIAFTLALRVPGWCKGASATLNGQPLALADITVDGYAHICRTFVNGDTISLTLPMPPVRVRCSGHVPFNAGRVALMRGPLVYCAEEADNGKELWNLVLNQGEIKMAHRGDLLDGVTVLSVPGARESGGNALYADALPMSAPCEVTFIPYYAWCNREPGEMAVWMRASR